MQCPICKSTNISLIGRLENVCPVSNFLFKTIDAALSMKAGVIQLEYCRNCTFVFNTAFDYNFIDYTTPYNNSNAASSYFNRYLDQLADYIIKYYSLYFKKVIEIGCGGGGGFSKETKRE